MFTSLLIQIKVFFSPMGRRVEPIPGGRWVKAGHTSVASSLQGVKVPPNTLITVPWWSKDVLACLLGTLNTLRVLITPRLEP